MTTQAYPLPQILSGLILATTLAATSSAASFNLTHQFGSVSHSRGSEVIDEESSAALTSFDLQANHTFNEAQVFINHPFVSAPVNGVIGTIYVSAITFDRDDRSSTAQFEYGFELHDAADYFFRYTKQGNADTSFLLKHHGNVQLSYTETEHVIFEGRLDPGEYSLEIDLMAFSPFVATTRTEQNYAQIDFALLVTPVPEPNTALLASALLVVAMRRRT